MEIKEQIENFGKEIKEDITKVNTELKSQLDGLQGQFDQLSVKQLDLNAKSLTFADEVKSKLSTTNEDLLSKGFKFEVKASLTQTGTVAPDQKPGIYGLRQQKNQLKKPNVCWINYFQCSQLRTGIVLDFILWNYFRRSKKTRIWFRIER
jgi:predicted nuclease with TOPRIM domain